MLVSGVLHVLVGVLAVQVRRVMLCLLWPSASDAIVTNECPSFPILYLSHEQSNIDLSARTGPACNPGVCCL